MSHIDPSRGPAWARFRVASGALWLRLLVFFLLTAVALGADGPVITEHPKSRVVLAGRAALLRVAAGGEEAMRYQWEFNEQPIAGATNPVLFLRRVRLDQAGRYRAQVSDHSGTRASATASLAVLPAASAAGWGEHLIFPVAGRTGRFTKISAGHRHSVALREDGVVVAWGLNHDHQCDVPPGLSNIIDVAAGYYHMLALRDDGTVVAWGYNGDGECRVPLGLMNVTAIAASDRTSRALLADGTIVGWGFGSGPTNASAFVGDEMVSKDGKVFTLWGTEIGLPVGVNNIVDFAIVRGSVRSNLAVTAEGELWGWKNSYVPPASLPTLMLTNVVAVAGGESHYLVLLAGGTVQAWGANDYGQRMVPDAATNVVGIACGSAHCLVLRGDGEVVSWGLNADGQCTSPRGLSNVVEVTGSTTQSVFLLEDGRLWGFGDKGHGGAIPAEATNVVAVSARGGHTLALRADGKLLAWGDNSLGQCSVPESATNVVSIETGLDHSLALREDGVVIAWGAGGPGTTGSRHYGQSTVPEAATNAIDIAAGDFRSLALRGDGVIVGWGQDGVRFIDAGSNIVDLSLSAALRDDGTLLWLGYGFSVADGISNVVALAVGTLALHDDGRVVNWRHNTLLPTPVSRCFAVHYGGTPYLALYQPEPDLPVGAYSLAMGDRRPGGYPALTLDGSADRTYRILVSTNLSDWSELPDVGTVFGGAFLEDPWAEGAPCRFYRAVTP